MKFILFVLLVGAVAQTREAVTREAVLFGDTSSDEFKTPEGMELVRRKIELHKAHDNLFEEYRLVKLKGHSFTDKEEEDKVYQELLAINAVLEKIQADAEELDADIDIYLSKL